MPGPIKPDEVVNVKRNSTPEFVFRAFNELIVEKWDGARAVVNQNDVIMRIHVLAAMPELTRRYIFDQGWLNVEDIYRKEGWQVGYSKPSYDETFDPYFTFTK